jgi:hypothetical protein
VNIAVQEATGGGRNVNDDITLAAQIIAKQSPGTPVQNIESIIIQMALETSKAQGKAITGQTIFEVANQIKQNPNGILTQAIIQLVKQDTQDNGKTGQTAKIIKTVIVEDRKTDGEIHKDEVAKKSEIKNKPSQGQGDSNLRQSIPTYITRPVSNAEKFGNWAWTIMQAVLPEEAFNTIESIVEQVPNINPSVSRLGAILSLGGAACRLSIRWDNLRLSKLLTSSKQK